MNKYNVVIESITWDLKVTSKVVDAKNISEAALIEMIKCYNASSYIIHIEEADNGQNEV